ncbi:MAG: hypothetical protein EBQ92_08585 [Proteobacteria bacterium]|nr:hypothetical protein [Pseudomonadota bacterium]
MHATRFRPNSTNREDQPVSDPRTGLPHFRGQYASHLPAFPEGRAAPRLYVNHSGVPLVAACWPSLITYNTIPYLS